jgi:hypothetical protein
MIRLVRQTVVFSHLSPLITYEPPDAWDITAERAYTTSPGARASLDWMGETVRVDGGQMGARADQSPPIDLVGSGPRDSRQGNQTLWLVNTSNPNPGSPLRYGMYTVDTLLFFRFTQEMRTLELSLPEDGEWEVDDPEADGERGTHLNVTRVLVNTHLPRSDDEFEG